MAMTLTTRRDPFADFDAMIRRAFPARTAVAAQSGFTPAAEITRDGDDALVTLELPGVDIDRDINVELDKNQLVISGERSDSRSEENEGRFLSEIRYGSFRRSFSLPEHVQAEAISAGYDAGLLTVRVSGAYAGTEPRKISVTPGKVAPSAPAADAIDAEGAEGDVA